MKKNIQKNQPHKKGELIVMAGPMFAGKTTKLLALFSILSNLNHNILCFKAEAKKVGGMGHTKSHDEIPLPVIYIRMDQPEKISQYVGKDGIGKVIIDAVHFFPKAKIMKVINKLLSSGIDVYVNGLIYDYRKKEYGATKSMLKKADDSIELFSICVRCGRKAAHTERISGGLSQSVATTGSKKAKYIAVCSKCHKIFKG
ncbi:hypothetical protein ACFL1A_00385 [Patescibacteria group bacterium]